ncbi:MAG: hypothetical protein M1438_08115, partial [Deltaproteobacteria bacterium]|nr:hypothetical protein [Deltaproteobacteria bacterium]
LLDAVEQTLATLSFESAAKDDDYPFWLTSETIDMRLSSDNKKRGPIPEAEVCIEINPQDARHLGIRAGEPIEAGSRGGTIKATAYLSDRVRPGAAFVPLHFRDEAIKLLLNAEMPGSKGCAVNLAKLQEQLEEIFGLKVPTSRYLHWGHAWVARESGSKVRLGLDDFSQRVLGPGDEIKLPEVGEEIRRNQAGLVLSRNSQKATVLAPLYGIIEAVNRKVLARPGLAHDDPYGDGWLLEIAPTNLEPDLDRMISGEDSAVWMEEETIRLLEMLEPSVGATLQTGGEIIDDVYGQFPQLGWERLVKEFLRSA